MGAEILRDSLHDVAATVGCPSPSQRIDFSHHRELDDDSERPHGTGGYYVLLWNSVEDYDEWYETAEALGESFADRTVAWFTPEDSATIPGRHRHGMGA